MNDIRLIAFDLDGTLLNSSKELTPATEDALRYASAKGIELVPATGRFYDAMPEAVRSLPFIRYCITINGAAVVDAAERKTLWSAEMSLETALRLMEYLDRFDVVYDCYQHGAGFMAASMRAACENYITSPIYQEMVRTLRKPVPELKSFLREEGAGVEKIQFFTKDDDLRLFLARHIAEDFPDTVLSSSIAENIEINSSNAHKGAALRKLSDILGIDMNETAAFGDGSNDVSMLTEAGIGIAMANACPETLLAADMVVPGCDEDGVAWGIRHLKCPADPRK